MRTFAILFALFATTSAVASDPVEIAALPKIPRTTYRIGDGNWRPFGGAILGPSRTQCVGGVCIPRSQAYAVQPYTYSQQIRVQPAQQIAQPTQPTSRDNYFVGPQGPAGPRGLQGATGPRGPQGPPGKDGQHGRSIDRERLKAEVVHELRIELTSALKSDLQAEELIRELAPRVAEAISARLKAKIVQVK